MCCWCCVLSAGRQPVPAGRRAGAAGAQAHRPRRAVGGGAVRRHAVARPAVRRGPRRRLAGASGAGATAAGADGAGQVPGALADRRAAAHADVTRPGLAVRAGCIADRRARRIAIAGHTELVAAGRAGRGADLGRAARRRADVAAGAAAGGAGTDLRRRRGRSAGQWRRTSNSLVLLAAFFLVALASTPWAMAAALRQAVE